jgi:hypothetical protein
MVERKAHLSRPDAGKNPEAIGVGWSAWFARVSMPVIFSLDYVANQEFSIPQPKILLLVCNKWHTGIFWTAYGNSRKTWDKFQHAESGSRCRKTENYRIFSQSFSLLLVKQPAIIQIFQRRRKQLDFHSNRFLSSFFASCQSTIFSCPDLKR